MADDMPSKPKRIRRPWPQTLVILLLLGQMLLYIGLAYLSLSSSVSFLDDVELEELIQAEEESATREEIIAISQLGMGAGLVVLVALTLFGAVTTIGQTKRAWRNVILAQGVTLLFALQLYFGTPLALFAYPLMLYAVFMVIYLMLPAVQAAFLPLGGDA